MGSPPTAPPIGTVSIESNKITAYQVTFISSLSGNPGNPTYLWETEDGGASIGTPTNYSTLITFSSADNYYVTCSVSDVSAPDSPQSASVFVGITDPPTTATSASYSIYQQINVIPDPSTYNIPSGSIQSFTIRRKTERNDKVIIFTNIPKGTEGVNSLSSGGYLIPEDLTEIQKQNVQIILNNLRSKRSFVSNNNSSTN